MCSRQVIHLTLVLGLLGSTACLRSLPQQDFWPLLLLGAEGSNPPPSVVSLAPVDGTTGISILGETFTVTFDRAMNPDSISVQSSSGPCTGTIWVAGDGGQFAECIGATLTTSDNTAFGVTPIVTRPSAGGNAQLRILGEVQATDGTVMGSDFQTSGGFTLFSPADYSGLALWLQADTINGFSDGNAITSDWNDDSNNGNNATPAANQPLYRDTMGPNSQPWVEFISASGQHFTLPNFMNFTEPTIFLVVFGSNTTIFADQGLGSQTFRINGNGGRFQLRIDDADGDFITNGAQITYTASDLSNWSIGSFRITGYTIDSYENGGNLGMTTPTGSNMLYDPTTIWNDGDQPHLGADSVGGNTWNGGIAEVILFNRSVSDSERARIECYLSRKYSISGPSC